MCLVEGRLKTPVRDLKSMFGTLDITSSIATTTCPTAAAIGSTSTHIGLYYFADIRNNHQNALLSIGTFRLVALWEVIDEIACWGLQLSEGCAPFPSRPSKSQSQALSLPLREAQELQRRYTESTALGLYSHGRSMSAIAEKGRGSHADKGYVLRPGIKLGVMISPFELLLPSEPLRIPFKEGKPGGDKSFKGAQSTKGSYRIGNSPLKSGKSHIYPTPEQKPRAALRNLRSIVKSQGDDWALKLPLCIVMKAAVEVKAVIFFYVPDPSVRIEEVEVTPMMIDTHSMQPVDHHQKQQQAPHHHQDHPHQVHHHQDHHHQDHHQEAQPHQLAYLISSRSYGDRGSSCGRETAVRDPSDDLGGAALTSEEHLYEWLVGGADHVFPQVEEAVQKYQNPLLALLCPCSIKMGATVTQVSHHHLKKKFEDPQWPSSHSCWSHLFVFQFVAATAEPSAMSLLRPSFIDWDNIVKSNTALITPCRLGIDSDLFLPSVHCFYERLHGVTPEVGII